VSEERRFSADETFRIPPMEYRLVTGRKGPGDLRLDWRWNDEGRVSPWRPVELDHVFLIVDAIADNENYLYPLPAAGGDYVRRFVVAALRNGWVQARHDLHLERMRKDELRQLT
jgi:hypothetical protein